MSITNTGLGGIAGIVVGLLAATGLVSGVERRKRRKIRRRESQVTA